MHPAIEGIVLKSASLGLGSRVAGCLAASVLHACERVQVQVHLSLPKTSGLAPICASSRVVGPGNDDAANSGFPLLG